MAREVPDEQRNVFRPLAKRGHDDVDRVEPIEEILAERAGIDGTFEISVGGRDHLHVDRLALARADRRHFEPLQHVEELRLQVERHLADLIEKHHATVRRTKRAERRAVGPGERPLFVAEKLALRQRRHEPTAIHRHKRLPGPRTRRMDGSGYFLLPAASLARDENRAIELCRPADRLLDAAHRDGNAGQTRPMPTGPAGA